MSQGVCLRCSKERDLHRGFCGACLKQRGVQNALTRESMWWKEQVLEIIRMTANKYSKFTADHVKDLADKMNLPPPHHPNVWGGVFHSALSKGYMYQTGKFTQSTRAKRHASNIAIYTTEKPSESIDWETRAKRAKKAWKKERALRRKLEAKLRALQPSTGEWELPP